MERDDIMKFNELEICKKTLDAISDMGFETMTAIQEKAIPEILAGKNIIGEAHTGTGKTAAFGIPLFEMMDATKREIQALIMAPTRELAIQIVEELQRIGKFHRYEIASLVGGMSIDIQAKALRSVPKIIVATPGRLVDHLEHKRLTLSNVKFFILDEVDEMLKVGFKEEIDKIIELLPSEKQTLLFSATISKSVETVAQSIGSHYETISVTDGSQSTDSITQYCVITKENNKFATLTKLLDIDTPKLAIVFGRTKRRADELNEALNKCGYKVSALHGDLSQGQRNVVLKKFKNNEIDILIATDVAARGLDVTGVSHVYNFDLPQEVEYYIHRIGRTGRANTNGVSYTFVRESEIPHIERIKRETKADIKIIDSPSMADIKNSNRDRLLKKIDEAITKAETSNKELATSLLDSYSPEDLATALVELSHVKRNLSEITLTGEPPVRTSRGFDNNRGGNRGFGRDRGPRNFGPRNDRGGDRPFNRDRAPRPFNRSNDRPRPEGGSTFRTPRPERRDSEGNVIANIEKPRNFSRDRNFGPSRGFSNDRPRTFDRGTDRNRSSFSRSNAARPRRSENAPKAE